MASTTTQLINNNFGGIRRKDAYFSAEKITCSDCQNVELFFTKLNSGVGIRTAKGNIAVTADIEKVELTVYKKTNTTMTSVSTEGIITGRTLSYSITVDEVSTLYTYTRSKKDDIQVSGTQYFAFKNKDGIVYTLKERNDIQRTSIFSDSEEIIDIYEATLNGVNRTFIYLVNDTVGKLYEIDLSTGTTALRGNNLTKTDVSCGTTYYNADQDIFIFSNGEEIVYVKYTNGSDTPTTVVHSKTSNQMYDVEGSTSSNIVHGLGIVVFDSRLWVFNGTKLWYSDQKNPEKFNRVGNSGTAITDAGIIHEVKDITAIYPYLGSLAVFFKDSSLLVEVDGSSVESKFKQTEDSPGGCAGYRSLVFHGTDLYFYDDTKKGVFSFKQIVLGDKTMGENIAVDIQEELNAIKSDKLQKIKALSVITDDRNEVWFLVPISNESTQSIVLIFDYVRGEWVKRRCQHINGMAMVDYNIHTVGKDVYREYVGKTFAGEFIEAYYTCSMLNLGADNTMKITKFPPRLTVDGNEISNFFVSYVKNYNYVKAPKIKEIKSKNNGNVLVYDIGFYDSNVIYVPNTINAIVKIPSSTFKSLEITFYITDEEQMFAIKNIEFSKIKVKQI